jgi:hypothetical protein
MEVAFDVLDHIFGYLRSDPKSLVACSKTHPVFSQLAEKYRYHHIVIRTAKKQLDLGYLEPSYLTKLLSDKPQIATYVHVVEIAFSDDERERASYLEQIAAILPNFLVLECLVLATPHKKVSWQNLPQSFRNAVEGCLRLPSLQEVHIGCSDFPLSTLDNHPNISSFSFSGTSCPSELTDTAYPQLKSLSVENLGNDPDGRTTFTAWAIRHGSKLQSLKHDYSSNDSLDRRLLQSCSDTLNNLDLALSSVRSDCESSF